MTGPAAPDGPVHVWEPTGPAEQRAAMGGLRIDAVPAHWNGGSWDRDGELLAIVDARSGETLADFRHTLEHRLLDADYIPDGRLHIGFGDHENQHVLMLDPEGARCRLAGGDWQSLDAMPALVDRALEEMRERQYARDVHSPDGRIRIEYDIHERRNGEWLESPAIFDCQSGECVFNGIHLNGVSLISNASHSWPGPGRVVLRCHDYYMPDLVVAFDLDAGTVRLQDGADQPIARAPQLVKKWLDRNIKLEKPAPQQAGGLPLGQRLKQTAIIGIIALLFLLALLYFGGLITGEPLFGAA